MSPRDDGGSALPFNEKNDDGTHYSSWPGMSLRDYFAATAWPALYAASSRAGELSYEGWREHLAGEAYRMADDMLKARQS